MPNILYKIDNQYPYFTKNEKKIAQFNLNYPHKVVNMTSQEIANQLETSSTSIIRLSKKVTPGGFNELKTRLITKVQFHLKTNCILALRQR